MDVWGGEVQPAWVDGPQLSQALPAQQPGLRVGILASLQQCRHQLGYHRFHGLTVHHVLQQLVLPIEPQDTERKSRP